MEMTSICPLNSHQNTKAIQLEKDNQKADQSLTSLNRRTLEEEIRAWDNDGTLQSLHEVLIETKKREKVKKWRTISIIQSTLKQDPTSRNTLSPSRIFARRYPIFPEFPSDGGTKCQPSKTSP
jgi:hypothetical protein